MVPGGVTEIIWHFLGYLHIFDDIARDRITLDEGDYRSNPEDYTTHRPQFTLTPADDETNSRPIGIQDSSAINGSSQHSPLSRLHPASDLHLDRFGPSPVPDILTPVSAGYGGGGGGSDVIKVVYQEGGEQSEIQTHQFNNMYDDDALIGTNDTNLLITLETEADHAIAQMVAGADAAIPTDWYVPQNTDALPGFVAAHDQAWADRDGAADPHSVTPGYYLNGVLQDPAPTPPDQLPAPDPATAPDLGHGLGQWALDGGNTASNAATIIDLTDSRPNDARDGRLLQNQRDLPDQFVHGQRSRDVRRSRRQYYDRRRPGHQHCGLRPASWRL